jgi:hypothetical protein
MSPVHRTISFIVSAVATFATSAVAQVPPDYGFDWVTIGAPGNRPTIPSEMPLDPTLRVGAVDHEYRIMRSKLDVESYLEFVNAYAPFWHGSPTDWELTGAFVVPEQQPQGGWTYQVRSGYEHCAARIEWQMAARYCNWLQNDKRPERAAFENGVYDTSTFHFTPNNWSAQLEPSPGAKYWIPSRDEWVKAAHFDPNRYGPGQGGYWEYPNGSNTPLIMGLPDQGGQRIGDLLWQTNPNHSQGGWPLGQYPHVQSPWGLIDISATVPDYTSFLTNYATATLAMGGSLAGSAVYAAFDRIDLFGAGGVWGDTVGALRIASSVPSTATAVWAAVGLVFLVTRRSRNESPSCLDSGVRHGSPVDSQS